MGPAGPQKIRKVRIAVSRQDDDLRKLIEEELDEDNDDFDQECRKREKHFKKIRKQNKESVGETND